MQTIYIDKLLAFDEQAKKNKTYLISKIKKEYDTTELLAYKKEIERQKLYERGGMGFLVFSAGASLIYFRNKRRKKVSEKKSTELVEATISLAKIAQNETIHTAIETVDFERYKPISKETVQSLLIKLKKFEEQKNFTKKGLKLYDLANEFGTNEKYLSKIISICRNKTFNQYLTDLRLDYLQELKKEKTKTENNKFLAEKIGFESYSLFFRAYKERFQENPSSDEEI